MEIGFTGSRQGMTQRQKDELRNFFKSQDFVHESIFHHGDCIGADEESDKIAKEYKLFIVVHPPEDPTYRAYCQGDEMWAPDEYMKRNQAIVNSCDILIAAPRAAERVRSGTWATVRMARRSRKKIMVLSWREK